ncbi:MAG TPA: glycosyltransferase [Kofleriaceae bacterium]|jgi:glycosyltransferase involved in cell wall biosynthesis
MARDTVLIYRDTLLLASETFILSQAESLSGFTPFYVGSRPVAGIEVPADRRWFVNDGSWLGRCREILFKVYDRVSPGQVEALARTQPRLIHAHFGPDGVLAVPLARALRLPLIVTLHGFDVTCHDDAARSSFYSHRKYVRRRGELIRGCSKVIAVSRFIAEKAARQGFPADKTLVHYIGVDVDKFQPRAGSGSGSARESLVLFVGRLVDKKGCSHLIRAMAEVQRAMPDVELVIIGDGPLRKALEAEAKASLRRYRFLGAQPSAVVRDWMGRAKVFSVPSITADSGDAEGFGIVFAEAQAMATPVASFASGGIPEAVAHGETGLLSPEKDWRGLARDIARLLGDDALWRRMSDRARHRVAEHFDLRKQTRLLEDIYRGLIDPGEAPAIANSRNSWA